MNKIKLTKEDVEAFKAELRENPMIPQEVIDAVEEGYYFINEDGIQKVSKAQYYLNSSANIIVYSAGLVSGILSAAYTNSELRTNRYGSTNDCGKPTGHGEAFEDMNNRKLRDEGHKVNSKIGKTYEYAGPDAIVDGKEVQYKCYANAYEAAENIANHHSYSNQLIYINSENAEKVRGILRQMEAEGRVTKGTADRVRDSGISIEEAKKVARPWTKESVRFDARTAGSTGIVVFVVTLAAFVAGSCILKKKITKKSFFKGVGIAAVMGGAGMLLHILFNQTSRNPNF